MERFAMIKYTDSDRVQTIKSCVRLHSEAHLKISLKSSKRWNNMGSINSYAFIYNIQRLFILLITMTKSFINKCRNIESYAILLGLNIRMATIIWLDLFAITNNGTLQSTAITAIIHNHILAHIHQRLQTISIL